MYDLSNRELMIVKEKVGDDIGSFILLKEDNYYYCSMRGITRHSEPLEFDGFNNLLNYLEIMYNFIRKKNYDKVIELIESNPSNIKNYDISAYIKWFYNKNPEYHKKIGRIKDLLEMKSNI